VTHLETIIMGVVVALIGFYSKMVGGRVTDLPRDYVPRVQVDARFKDLEQRLEREMAAIEGRSDKRFDSVDSKLDNQSVKIDRILAQLSTKVDR